jgi:serine/threonine-protein kinase
MRAQASKSTLDIRRDTRRCASCEVRFSGDAAFCPFDGTKLEAVAAAADPLVDPLLGTTIDGRYEVMELLGQGGMGHVYEVRHIALDRRFAMKVLRRDLARDGELALRFIQEAKATAAIVHPNVVEITDFGRLAEGAPYFVMELLVGQTLGRVLKAGGPLPARRAVRIVQQVAAALAAAHAAGVVHRDLKPENVFLVGGAAESSVRDDVRVVDFGAAKIVGSSRVTREDVVFGTPHYMSPEQASGQPVDHRADVYALGIIMYEMFTGRVPFEADTYMGVLTQHMFVQPVPPSHVSPAARALGALEEVTMICLAKKPEERYASMEELSASLRAIIDVKSDGSVRIAPRLAARPGRAPASLRYPMADELEPPTLEEMRVAIDSVLPPRRVVPYAWIAAAGAVIVAGSVGWAVVERVESSRAGPGDQGAAAVGASTAATLPSASTAVSPPAAPPREPAAGPSASGHIAGPARSQRADPNANEGPAPQPPVARPPIAKKPTWTGIDDVGDPFENRR